MLTTSLPQLTTRLEVETADLSLEIFATTPNVDWRTADAMAEALVDYLLDEAIEWDCEARAAGNHTAVCPF